MIKIENLLSTDITLVIQEIANIKEVQEIKSKKDANIGIKGYNWPNLGILKINGEVTMLLYDDKNKVYIESKDTQRWIYDKQLCQALRIVINKIK